MLTALTHSAQTWTPYSREEKRIYGFNIQCLCKILKIKGHDKVINMNIWQMAKLPSLISSLSNGRLSWLEHVRRMPNNRILKQVAYGKTSEGRSLRGKPKLIYKEVCKMSLNS
jgi:hypothetical protein